MRRRPKLFTVRKDHRKDKFKTVQFDFLGFSFQPRPTSNHGGEMFLGYDCAISRKSENKISEIFRKSEFHLWTECDISHIAKVFNPKISGMDQLLWQVQDSQVDENLSYLSLAANQMGGKEV